MNNFGHSQNLRSGWKKRSSTAFMADHLGAQHAGGNSTPFDRAHLVEPFTLLSALSMATDRLGPATGSTTYDEPIVLPGGLPRLIISAAARRAAIVTTSNPDASKNFDEKITSNIRALSACAGILRRGDRHGIASKTHLSAIKSGFFRIPTKCTGLTTKATFSRLRAH